MINALNYLILLKYKKFFKKKKVFFKYANNRIMLKINGGKISDKVSFRVRAREKKFKNNNNNFVISHCNDIKKTKQPTHTHIK